MAIIKRKKSCRQLGPADERFGLCCICRPYTQMKWWLYGLVMKIAHKYNWHYAPPIYPEGDTMLWCKWCGFREVIKRAGDK